MVEEVCLDDGNHDVLVLGTASAPQASAVLPACQKPSVGANSEWNRRLSGECCLKQLLKVQPQPDALNRHVGAPDLGIALVSFR
jgi:hypothetical protein